MGIRDNFRLTWGKEVGGKCSFSGKLLDHFGIDCLQILEGLMWECVLTVAM